MADDQFGSGLNFGSDQVPQQSQPSSPSFGNSFSDSSGSFFGGPRYKPADPAASPLDQSADLLTQRLNRANQVAVDPWAQIFAPDKVQAARDFVPKAVEQLQTIQKQKADIQAGRQQAASLGLDPGEVSDQATRDDRIAAAQQRALGGDLRAFQGLQAVAPKDAEAIQDQVHSAVSRNLDTAQTAFDRLSNVRTQDEYEGALAAMRNGGDLKNLDALGLKIPDQLSVFNAQKGREAEALRNARIGVDTIRQRLEDRNTYQPMPKAEADTYANRLITVGGDPYSNGTWSRNSAAGTRGYVVNGMANPKDLGNTFTLGSADQREQLGKQADQLVPKNEMEKYRFFNRTVLLATTDAKGNPLPAGTINTNPNVQQGIAEGLAGMLRGGLGSANIGLMKIETAKRGFIQGLIDKINTEKAATLNELKGADVNPYLSKLTQSQIRDVLDVVKQYNDQSIGNRLTPVAQRAGALGFDSSAVGLAKGEGGAVDDAVERGRQAQIARMTPFHQAIGGGDGVIQIGAQRPGAGATGTPEGSAVTTQLPGAPALQTPVQQQQRPSPSVPGSLLPPPAGVISPTGTTPSPVGTPTTMGAASGALGPAGGGPLDLPGRRGLTPGMQVNSPDALEAYKNRVIQLESGWQPKQKTGSYEGLGQYSKAEQAKHGITDPDDPKQVGDALKADAAARIPQLQKDNIPATPANLYLSHQQGDAGLRAHLANPDGVAWQNLKPYYRTDALAKLAVSGNMTPSMRGQFPGGVDTVTSGDFVRMWNDRVNGTDVPSVGGKGPPPLLGASRGLEPPPLSANQRAPRMTEAETVSKNFEDLPWYKRAVAGLMFGRDAEGGVEGAKQYGPEGGSIVGGAIGAGLPMPGGMAVGGAAGGAGGQMLKDWLSGNPQNPTEILHQGVLSGVLGVAPEGRPVVGALTRTLGAGAVEGVAKKAEGGDAGDVAEAALQGTEGATVGEAFGRALGMVGHKIWSMFSSDSKAAIQSAAEKFSKADDVLKTEQPKIVTPTGTTPNPKYDAADKARTEAETVLKDAGFKPDEAAHAYKVTSEGVPQREAQAARPGAIEKVRVGAGYQQLESEVGAAGKPQIERTGAPAYGLGTDSMPIRDASGKKVGDLDFSERPDAIKVTYPFVEPTSQNQGLATAAYSKLADYGLSQGKPIMSDAAVTDAASNVYGALKRRGYTVESNPNVSRNDFGVISSGDGQPVYKITASPNTSAGSQNGIPATPSLPDGPMAVAAAQKMPKTTQDIAERTEMNITAPAPDRQAKWVQLKDERQKLLKAERDAATSNSKNRTQTAEDMRTLADSVRVQQVKFAKEVFGEQGGQAVINRLQALDKRYATLMDATNDGNLEAAAAFKGEKGRAADRAFRAFAQDDKAALAAWDAMRVKAGNASATTEQSILSQIRLENVPGIGRYLAAGKSAIDLGKWARERTAGNPVKFEDLVPELVAAKAERARTGSVVRNIIGSVGARLGVQETSP